MKEKVIFMRVLIMQSRLLDIISSEQIQDDPSLELWNAAYAGNLEKVKELLKININVDAIFYGVTPLMAAITENHIAIVEELLKHSADVNLKFSAREHTPLRIAALEGHVEIIEMLVKAGANVSCATSIGHTALQCAHISGQDKAAKKLIELGSIEDVSQGWLAKQFLKYTSLIDYKQYDRRILENFCRSFEKGMCTGWTLRWLIKNDKLRQTVAKWNGSKETLTSDLETYFQEFSQVQWLHNTRLYLLPELSQAMPDKLLNFISEKNQQFHIPFCFAFIMTRDELIMILNEIVHENQKIYIGNFQHSLGLKKIENNYVVYDSNSGANEITCHSIEELAFKIEMMLPNDGTSSNSGISVQVIESTDCKANFNYQNVKDKLLTYFVNNRKINNQLDLMDWKYNSLALAAKVNDIQTATALIEAGANVNPQRINLSAIPPLLIVANNNCSQLAEKLINFGADLNSIWGEESPLLTASLYGNKEIIKIFIKHGANLTLEIENRTALSTAAAVGALDIMKMLISNANPKYNDHTLDKAIKSALLYNQLEALKYLISIKPLPEKPEKSILTLAIFKGNLQIVKFLVEECLQNITEPDATGLKPLSMAIYREKNSPHVHSDSILKYLLEKIDKENLNTITSNNFSFFNGNKINLPCLSKNSETMESTHAQLRADNFSPTNLF